MSPVTVLFDLDGTLTDPAVGILTGLRAGLTAAGIDPGSVGRLERFIGPPLQECFAEVGLGPDGVAVAIAAYRAYYGEAGLYQGTLHAGVLDVLEALSGCGAVLGVATSKPRPYAERIVAHFGLTPFFATVAGPELDGSNRHKHEVIALALAALGAGPGRAAEPGAAVMVGDRSHDMVGARRTGLLPVGVTWGFGSAEELVGAGAAHLVHSPAELGAFLVTRRPGSAGSTRGPGAAG